MIYLAVGLMDRGIVCVIFLNRMKDVRDVNQLEGVQSRFQFSQLGPRNRQFPLGGVHVVRCKTPK